jgi:hypothetical protein
MTLSALVLLLLPACRDELETGDTQSDWEIVLGEFEAGLIGIWAPADDDVWTVGADPGDGMGGYVYHFDGTDWTRIDTGTQGNFWWVHGDGLGTVWMFGEDGLAVRWTAETGPVAIETPHKVNLFGAYVFADDDVLVCGGDAYSALDRQVLWRWNGKDWDDLADVAALRSNGAVLTKIFARGPDNIWVVGGANDGLRYQNGQWKTFDIGTRDPLTAVFGNDELIIGAGGGGQGVIIEDSGKGFQEIRFEDAQPLNGISVAADGRAVATGWYGSIHLRDLDGNWSAVDNIEIRHQDFHSTSVTPSGTVYVSGGLFAVTNIYDGILLRGSLSPADDKGTTE